MRLDERGFLASRLLPSGAELAIHPLTYGRARLCIGPAGADGYDDGW